MAVLIVVESPRHWPLDVRGADIVLARDYLTDPRFVDLKRATVFNLCRSYGYQSMGYYVSLLAAARGHKPLPSVKTLQDLRLSSVVRVVSEDLGADLQRAFAPLKTERFQLSIYFGRNMAKRYDRICQALFDQFPSPLLRAEFVKADQWRLQSIRPIATSDIPSAHAPFVIEQAQRFFARRRRRGRSAPRYEMAILVNPDEVDAPSDERAIGRFVRAARRIGIQATVIGREQYGRIAEYDALFIRETTYVNNHTYRFASRAAAEGLVVIDHPESIVRCTNKVYQAELFEHRGVPTPRTVIAHRDNASTIADELGWPCVLKRPDSSFSAGVVKVESREELDRHLEEFFDESELVVAQEFVPSGFDWRVGVLDRRALWVCRYYMARGHWQIMKHDGAQQRRYGRVETLRPSDAPPDMLDTAVRAAGLIGDGLYGVDIKEVDGRFLVMEVNDNPNIDAGYEDAILKDGLYDAIMRTFLARLERRGQG